MDWISRQCIVRHKRNAFSRVQQLLEETKIHKTSRVPSGTLLCQIPRLNDNISRMQHRLQSAWSSYAEAKLTERDGRLFSRSNEQQQKDRARVGALLAALKTATKSRDIETVRKIHLDAIANGDDSNVYVASNLVNLYAKCGSMEDAQKAFDKIPWPNVVSWTALMSGYVQDGQGEVALDLFSRMQSKGCVPDGQIFVAAVKACLCLAAKEEGKLVNGQLVKVNSLEKGMAIHSKVRDSSSKSDIFLSNTFIDFYAKCGNMKHAREVFDSVSRPDVISWTSLIMGYAQNGQGELALELFSSMKSKGCVPNGQTYLAVIKACTELATKEQDRKVDGRFLKGSALQKGRELHAEASKHGYSSDIFVANTLIDMYAKCGSMADAQKVFDRIVRRVVVSWNALILGYVNNGEPEVAVQLFERMRSEGCPPNGQTFVAALKACTSLAAKEEGEQTDGKSSVKTWCLDMGLEVSFQAAKFSYDSDIFVANTMIDMFSKCGSMRHAREVFDKISRPDVVSWTALISGYAQNGEGELALELFKSMHSQGCAPNGQTIVAALKACMDMTAKEDGRLIEGKVVKESSLEQGEFVYSQAAKTDCILDIFVASALVDMYAKCGSMASARAVFEAMKRHDVVVWNALMLGYIQNGESEVALELFTRMQSEGCLPDAQTFSAAIKACGASLPGVDAKKQESLDQVSAIHSQVTASGFESDIFVASTLLDLYAKLGNMEKARKVFDGIKNHNVVSWSTLISGYAQNGEPKLALEMFQRMQFAGCTPNAQTFVAVLKACGSMAALGIGKSVHACICRLGAENDTPVANSLVHLYGRSGSVVGAEQVFESIMSRDAVTWNALMASYSHQADTDKVLQLNHRMQEEGVKPDGVTLNFILTACSHAGLVDKGKQYFQAMSSKYGIAPDLEHYHCMIDLLGRGNQLEAAVEMVRTMPFKPNVITWTIVLAACRKWKNVPLGRLAFEALLALDETQAPSYVLMGNIYAAAGMWEEKARVHAMRKNAKAWKKPGQSWWSDDNSGAVHTFVAGDSSHIQNEAIREKLKSILVKMKEEHGYIADTGSVSWDVSEEEKEDSLCGHSERLAIACALLNSAPGTIIRIGKNLRVCDDCHRATALISKMEQRAIICRDASRFHVFEDGKCSCGDFW